MNRQRPNPQGRRDGGRPPWVAQATRLSRSATRRPERNETPSCKNVLLGGTGFQPVVSGVPPETRRPQNSELSVPSPPPAPRFTALPPPQSALNGSNLIQPNPTKNVKPVCHPQTRPLTPNLLFGPFTPIPPKTTMNPDRKCNLFSTSHLSSPTSAPKPISEALRGSARMYFPVLPAKRCQTAISCFSLFINSGGSISC